MPELTILTNCRARTPVLLIATLIIVVDVRVPIFDIVPDAVGGALVLYAMLRLRSVVRGAGQNAADPGGPRRGCRSRGRPGEPWRPIESLGPLLLSQPIGAYVLAGLTARVLAEREPERPGAGA